MKTILSIALAVIIVGCATIPQGTTPSAYPLISEDGKINNYDVVGKGEGTAGHFTLFGFIPFGKTDIEYAVRDAISIYQGNNLINVRYYVKNTSYIIGNYTSINVKGDVIKYGAQVFNGAQVIKPLPKTSKIIQEMAWGSSHKFTIGSAIDGFGVDYSFQKNISDLMFYSFTLGYKSCEKTRTGYQFWPTYREYTYKFDYDVLPLSINFGMSAKKFLDLPMNPYLSAGLSYIPTTEFELNQIGFNINIGADYKLTSNFALGIDYRYLYSLTDVEYIIDGSFLTYSPDEGLTFSNLSISLVYYP